MRWYEASVLVLRCERALALLVKEMPKNRGTKGNIQEQISGRSSVDPPDDTPTFDDLDIGKPRTLAASEVEQAFVLRNEKGQRVWQLTGLQKI